MYKDGNGFDIFEVGDVVELTEDYSHDGDDFKQGQIFKVDSVCPMNLPEREQWPRGAYWVWWGKPFHTEVASTVLKLSTKLPDSDFSLDEIHTAKRIINAANGRSA
jgi:hypothetical protein